MLPWLGNWLPSRFTYLHSHRNCEYHPLFCHTGFLYGVICIYGLPNVIPKSHISIYADDIRFRTSALSRRNISQRLKKVGSIVFPSIGATKLSAVKSRALSFTWKDMAGYPIIVAGCLIPDVKQRCYLGVRFNITITWAHHVNELERKLLIF